MSPLTEVTLPLKKFKTGKVREVFDLKGNVGMVATGRISAFDWVLPNGIPYKGAVLTQISNFWFGFTQDIIDNHLLVTDFKNFPPDLRKFNVLNKRSVIVRKTEPIPIECVVRGYLSGSGWKEYQETGKVCGIELPAGLKESDKLPSPIFTPATKAESGHDLNIPFEKVVEEVGDDDAEFLRDTSIAIYKKASEHALSKGIIIADTKFEFGYLEDEIIVIDEMLTPDSSRFWPLDSYKPGGAQPSFDKQFVRDYLNSISWNREPPIPKLPPEVIEGTTKRYLEAYECLTGKKLI